MGRQETALNGGAHASWRSDFGFEQFGETCAAVGRAFPDSASSFGVGDETGQMHTGTRDLSVSSLFSTECIGGDDARKSMRH